jgi:hypothetical protein
MVVTQKITKVAGISERRRLPRLGKIRLGVKAINPKTGNEYPKEVDYFVVPPEVAKVYGEKPKELDIMFPVNSVEVIFPQAYKWYGDTKGLKCIGNGQIAYRLDEKTGEMVERECPCELLNNGCMLRGHLLVILPRINMGGVYQIDVGSYNSIVDINSALEYIEALIGRFAMVPLKLKRVPKEIPYEGKLRVHYPLQIVFEGDINLINTLREDNKRIIMATENLALPAPEDINPKHDPEAVVVVENGENESEDESVNENSQATTVTPVPAKKVATAPKSPVQKPAPKVEASQGATQGVKPPTDAQLNAIRNIALRNGYDEGIIETFLSQVASIKDASNIITTFGKGDFTLLDKFIAELDVEEVEVPEEVTTQEPF